jgi:hypothetical protein
MVTIKPHVNINKSTEGLPRRQQVAVSRLRMVYTNIMHRYKIRDELKPHCEKCDQEVTVEDFAVRSVQLSKKEKQFHQRFNG